MAICRSPDPPDVDINRPWSNWSGEQNYVVPSYYEPTSLEELVWVVEQAHAQGVRLKSVGSGWSFEDIAVSQDWVVDIGHLDHYLEDSLINASTLNSNSLATLEYLIHIEAGRTIWETNDLLDGIGKAMPTLGGSGGQTLAGAFATSTHGSDLEFGPIHDRVRAIHLVSTGGQEYWIEPETNTITGIRGHGTTLAPQALCDGFTCQDTIVVYSDELFNAVQVSAGRFGVIYAYVIEVEDAFWLEETVTPLPWSTVRDLLRGPFAQFLGSLPRSAENPQTPPRFVDVLISPHVNDDENCHIRQRFLTGPATIPGPSTEPFNILCSISNVGLIIAGMATGLSIAIATVSAFPVIGPLLAIPLIVALGAVLALIPASGMTLGELIVNLINIVTGVGQGQLVRGLMGDIFSSQLGQGRILPSHQMMAGTVATVDQTRCYRSNSLEAIFLEEPKRYVDFIEDLRTQARGRLARNQIVAGYFSVRFSKPSQALVSMHNLETNFAVSIEVAVLQGITGNDEWMNLVERSALRHGGILHWGQHNTLVESEVESFYGERLERWRAQLGALVDTNMTFSNNYTFRRGLEPAHTGWTEPVILTCTERRRQDTDNCIEEEDRGFNRCAQEADRGRNECAAEEDRGRNDCARRRDLGFNRCCTWWPCSMFCEFFVWISNIVCVAWVWVANIVCVATVWVARMVCVATVWVARMVCVAWAWTTSIVCTVTGSGG